MDACATVDFMARRLSVWLSRSNLPLSEACAAWRRNMRWASTFSSTTYASSSVARWALRVSPYNLLDSVRMTMVRPGNSSSTINVSCQFSQNR